LVWYRQYRFLYGSPLRDRFAQACYFLSPANMAGIHPEWLLHWPNGRNPWIHCRRTRRLRG